MKSSLKVIDTDTDTDADADVDIHIDRASLVAQKVKHLLAMWETHVRSLGWEDSLEKGTFHLPLQGLNHEPCTQ